MCRRVFYLLTFASICLFGCGKRETSLPPASSASEDAGNSPVESSRSDAPPPFADLDPVADLAGSEIEIVPGDAESLPTSGATEASPLTIPPLPATDEPDTSTSNSEVAESDQVVPALPVAGDNRDKNDSPTATPAEPADDHSTVGRTMSFPESCRRPATDSHVDEAIRAARSQTTAAAALDILEVFEALHRMTWDQSDRLTKERALATDRATKNLLRNGSDWVTAEEVASRQAEADHLIEQAIGYLKAANVEAAIGPLQAASKIDGNSIRADFALGLLMSTRSHYDGEKAKRRFQNVLDRCPGHVSALNNLALAELRLREFGPALNHWSAAVELLPWRSDVTHNIARVVSEAEGGKLDLSKSLLRKYSKFNDDISSSIPLPASGRRRGWLYTPLVLPRWEQNRPAGDVDSTAVPNGWAMGIVVADQYILTSLSAVEDDAYGRSHRITVQFEIEDSEPTEIDAETISTAPGLGLALLKADDLKIPPLSIAEQVLERGQVAVALQGTRTGDRPESVKVEIFSLPGEIVPGYLVAGSGMDRRTLGGPICDQYGNVLALTTAAANLNYLDDLVAGVPGPDIRNFLSSSPAASTLPSPATDRDDNQPRMEERVARSMVLVVAYHTTASLGMQALAGRGNDYLEDKSCSRCFGAGMVPCPRRGCVRGAISTPQRVFREKNRLTGEDLYTTKHVKSPCPTCHGKGAVSCGSCSNGIDTSL